MLTRTQKTIVWVGLGLLILLAVVVPWRGAYQASAGYHLIFLPSKNALRIDLPRVILPMVIVAIATTVAVILTRPPRSDSGGSS